MMPLEASPPQYPPLRRLPFNCAADATLGMDRGALCLDVYAQA